MEWHGQVDGYCERTDFSFWSEPVNAVTNGFYTVGALYMLWRLRGEGLPVAQGLAVLLLLISIGSFLFHTYATGWAGLSDVVPIGLFILLYLFGVLRNMLGLPTWAALVGTAAFVPYAAVLVPVLDSVPFFAISNFYWTVPILLVLVAPLVWRTRRETALGMVAGAAALCLSIATRSVDELWCQVFPIGTHFLWHMLNALILPAMIELYRRHVLAMRSAKAAPTA